jgi:hypothetical protein
MSMLPYQPPSPSSHRVSRRGFLAASAIAVPAVWALGTSGVASAAPARRAGATSSAVGLAWHDITNQAVNAANFAEPVTQSRTWAVSWLAAARALRGNDHADYAVAAFVQALHNTLAAQVPSQQASLDASLAATLASVADGPAKKRGIAAGAHEASVIVAERAGEVSTPPRSTSPGRRRRPLPASSSSPRHSPGRLSGRGRATPARFC